MTLFLIAEDFVEDTRGGKRRGFRIMTRGQLVKMMAAGSLSD